MSKTENLESLMEAIYPRLRTAYFERFYEELLEEGVDAVVAEKLAIERSDRAAYSKAERLAEAQLDRD